jgi:hypothetical protein
MSSAQSGSSVWKRLSPVEWAYVAGILVLTVGAIFFAYRFITATDPAPLPQLSNVVRDGPSADGYLLSADEETVVIELGNGKKRTFTVRPGTGPEVGLPHLVSHAGARDLGFRIYYQTDGGRDYIVGAAETGIPQVGSN